MQIDIFNTLTFQYNTGSIPPPFCHQYTLTISRDDTGNYLADLDLEYFDRDEISEEEIIDEGYSIDDNYKWKGSLPKFWVEEILNMLKSSNWKKKPSPGPHGSEFVIKIDHHAKLEVIQPADTRLWEVFVQEIIQAVFELGKKESPLYISFVNKISIDQINQVEFEFSFAHRLIKTNKQKTIPWPVGQKLLKYIFGFDYLPENSIENIPDDPGNYINPGDGYWYQLAPNKNAGTAASEKVEKLIETLISYTK